MTERHRGLANPGRCARSPLGPVPQAVQCLRSQCGASLDNCCIHLSFPRQKGWNRRERRAKATAEGPDNRGGK
eukprot:448145-Lingulodinium_polyedra.AAC.1